MPSQRPITPQRLKQRIDAAQGRIECDLVLKDVHYLDVFSCEWRKGNLSVHDGTIVGVDDPRKSKRTIDGKGKWVVPGFIDAHVHIESSLMIPGYFESAVLPLGTTTAICDPHELANVRGTAGIEYFLQSAEALSIDLWIMLSSCVPATHMETNGGGKIGAEALLTLLKHPRALGLAEMMNIPGVLQSDKDVIDKLVSFSSVPIDGHCPLLRGEALSAYAATGISSCHESSELEEAREKLRKGVAVWIREGSVAKDLKALAPLLTLATSTSIGFCTDDRNPLDIAVEGHIDHLIRNAIRYAVPTEVAYRAASWSVARHYGLNAGPNRVGAIAPGYASDLVLLDDPKTCAIHSVLKGNTWATDVPPVREFPTDLQNSIQAKIPDESDLNAPQGNVHVIGVRDGKILTDRFVLGSSEKGVAKLSVLERYGKGSKPANAYVKGFGENFHGAIASSVGHDSHNLIAVGDSTKDIRAAMAAVSEVGGGFCVVKEGNVIERLPLPFGGLMSNQEPSELKSSLEKMRKASYSLGCELHEPFLQLAFLSLPVIPSLKLTDKGLVDVEKFKIIDVRA